MQIHELNTFTGTPGDLDYLAIDTGFDTAKISAKELLKGLTDDVKKKVNIQLDNLQNPVYGNAGQLLRTNGDGTTEWVDEGLPTDEQTETAINKWLDDHPEATTTVADGSLTYEKFVLGTLGYVTPEMYGAKGDGVTDDTTAITNAFNSGMLVFGQGTYKFSSFGDPSDPTAELKLYGGEYVGSIWCKNLIAENVKFFHSQDNVSNLLVTVRNTDSSIIRNCVFDGDSSTIEDLLGVSGSNIVVDGCTFKDNLGRGGLAAVSCIDTVICNNYVNNIGGYGIQLFQICKNVTVDNNLVIDCNFASWGGGTGTDGCISTYGDTTGTNTTPSENIVFSNNVIVYTLGDPAGGGTGIRFNGVKHGRIVNNYIYAGRIARAIFIQDREHSGYIVNNDDIDVSNNYIYCSIAAIYILSGKNMRIKGNTILVDATSSVNSIVLGNGNTATNVVTGELDFSDNYIEHIAAGDSATSFMGNNTCNTIMKNNVFNCNRSGTYYTKTLLAIGNVFHSKKHNYCLDVRSGKGVVANNLYGRVGFGNGSLQFTTPTDFTVENNINDGIIFA